MEAIQKESSHKAITKSEAIDNWSQFQMSEELVQALVANKFMKPTQVQAQSLVFLNQHVDMVIAAKTGQGKTLCFGLPILDLLIKRLEKETENEDLPKFSGIKALIMSPTRELALQIKDHLQAVVPVQHQESVKICPLVGGMSVHKQERLLSQKPSIVVATPGRLWELISERQNEYLVSELPMIDVLVLDEADRMIEDGHFRELQEILDFVYAKRVEYKKLQLLKGKEETKTEADSEKLQLKSDVLNRAKQSSDSQFVVKKIEQRKDVKIDMAQVEDLYDEDQILQEMNPEDLIIDELDTEKKEKDADGKKKKKKSQQQVKQENEESFQKEYKKMGGIQHIICSATMTIDQSGRITPKKAKKLKKQGYTAQQSISTLESLCKTLRFRSKQPKVIDLTEEERMPDTLTERAIKCTVKEKDLYAFYFLRQKKGESTIVFCNSITCTKRVSSILAFLKVQNLCLHSKMQQRQRLKNLDRFKSQVQACESGASEESAVLVCTDVAARGLDIPFVQNVLHYQCPYNAEIYVHRCGRTARIGRSGESLALLSAEDEKNFRLSRKVLNKDSVNMEMYQVSYTQLAQLEPLVEAAAKFESTLHKEAKEQKGMNQMLQMAKQADLDLDDSTMNQLMNKQQSSNKKKGNEVKAVVDIFDEKELQAVDPDDSGARRKQKTQSKVQAMKQKYERLQQEEQMKKVSNSSFLTPEAASYLNELIRKDQSMADSEVVYAGMHSELEPVTKHKRNEKYKARYKNRTKKRKRKH